MTKNEWLARRVGFEKAMLPYGFTLWTTLGSEDTNADPPDFEHSLDAQVKWVWSKAIDYDTQFISLFPPDIESPTWGMFINHVEDDTKDVADFGGNGQSPAEASFHACCAALGWADKED